MTNHVSVPAIVPTDVQHVTDPLALTAEDRVLIYRLKRGLATVFLFFVSAFFASRANAQPGGGGGLGFNRAGEALGKAFCEFTGSTIVIVIVAFGLLGLLIAFALNEDNRFLSGVLKAAIGGTSIFFISSIVRLLNIGDLGC